MIGRFFNSPPSERREQSGEKYRAYQHPDYFSMDKFELARHFLPESWYETPINEKFRMIQALENQCAREQGRPARNVWIVDTGDHSTLGYFDPQKNEIAVSAYLMNDGGDYGLAAPYLVYDTITHEGFHAYEKDRVDGRVADINPDETEVWRKNNAVGYIDGQFVSNYRSPPTTEMAESGLYSGEELNRRRHEYKLQPNETAAYNYAGNRTKEVFDKIQEDRGAPLPGYEQYKNTQEINSPDAILAETNKYDAQFQEHLDASIDYVDECVKRGEWIDVDEFLEARESENIENTQTPLNEAHGEDTLKDFANQDPAHESGYTYERERTDDLEHATPVEQEYHGEAEDMEAMAAPVQGSERPDNSESMDDLARASTQEFRQSNDESMEDLIHTPSHEPEDLDKGESMADLANTPYQEPEQSGEGESMADLASSPSHESEHIDSGESMNDLARTSAQEPEQLGNGESMEQLAQTPSREAESRSSEQMDNHSQQEPTQPDNQENETHSRSEGYSY